jgi:predicted CoA-binding protein
MKTSTSTSTSTRTRTSLSSFPSFVVVSFATLFVVSLYYYFETTTTTAMSFHKTPAETIRKVLTNSRTIALVGASAKAARPSNYVMKYLLDYGYNVIPINPGLEGQELHGKTVYGSLSSIPKEIRSTIDMVDIFRNSEAVPPIVDEAISIGAKSIWMQSGIIDEAAAETATNAGLDIVMDTCPKIEIPQLSNFSGPSSSSSSSSSSSLPLSEL